MFTHPLELKFTRKVFLIRLSDDYNSSHCNLQCYCCLRAKNQDYNNGYGRIIYSNDKLHVLRGKQRKLHTLVKKLDCTAFS